MSSHWEQSQAHTLPLYSVGKNPPEPQGIRVGSGEARPGGGGGLCRGNPSWDFPVKTPLCHWISQHQWKTAQSFPRSPSCCKSETQSTNLARNGIIFHISASILLCQKPAAWLEIVIFVFFIFVLVWFLLLTANTNYTEHEFHGLSRKVLQEMEKHSLFPR